jgi:response regulator of citrate/malate metabolism
MQKQIASVSETGDKPTDNFINSIITALEDYQKDLAIKQIELAFEQSQKEVDDLRKITAQGMAAKGAGDKIREARSGQKFVTIKSYELRIAILKELKNFGGALNNTQFAKQHDISRMTLYRYLEEIQKDMECSSSTPKQQIAFYRGKIKAWQNK